MLDQTCPEDKSYMDVLKYHSIFNYTVNAKGIHVKAYSCTLTLCQQEKDGISVYIN